MGDVGALKVNRPGGRPQQSQDRAAHGGLAAANSPTRPNISPAFTERLTRSTARRPGPCWPNRNHAGWEKVTLRSTASTMVFNCGPIQSEVAISGYQLHSGKRGPLDPGTRFQLLVLGCKLVAAWRRAT